MSNSNEKVAKRLSGIIADMNLADPEPEIGGIAGGPRRRRRGFSAKDYNGLATLSLVDDDGLLCWVYRPPKKSGVMRRRARRSAIAPIESSVVHEFSFRETPPNTLIAALEGLDSKLTPARGLHRYRKGKLESAEGIALSGRVLLLIHGTFSKSDMFFDELNAIPEGKAFLGRAEAEYDAVLAFDHPTLSVSPWINALDLEHALAKVTGSIDVICHSRGGLVAAWWLRNARRKVDNVVFVGTPLEGTSLASPANLRAALQGLANIFKGLEMTGAAVSTVAPFMGVVTGLAKVLGGILNLGANTPLADAAVAVVPGLAGQSRVKNSAELDRLHRSQWISTPKFHAVISNFNPGENDSWWQVWKFLRDPVNRAMNWGADAIFKDENNDLVVNTQSMTRLFGTSIKSVHDFKTSSKVHHCNYFRQPDTAKFLRDAVGI